MKTKGDNEAHFFTIIDSRDSHFSEFFTSKASCKEWIMEGMTGTDGAERDHYVSLLCQMEGGKNVLDYSGECD